MRKFVRDTCLRLLLLALGSEFFERCVLAFSPIFSSCSWKRNCNALPALSALEPQSHLSRRARRRKRGNKSSKESDFPTIPPISDTTPCEVIEDKDFYFPSSETWNARFPKGDQGGYHIVRQYTVSAHLIQNGTSIALQHALAALDPLQYPTLTRARKACRKGLVLVRHKQGHFVRAKVGDMLQEGDVIGCQMFLGTYRKKQCYPNIEYPRPQFELPVLYEDDHLAVLNKPAGIAVYSETRMDGSGKSVGNRRTVHFALPFVLSPPKEGTQGVLRRPGIVHRLDKATSGLLVVAKTKKAMESLKDQFENRKIQKMYTAIVNGDLRHESTSQTEHDPWNVIDYPLGGKYAITAWKIARQSVSLNAKDGMLTMINIRLHTGRYHQIRRHFAWWCRRPLVGDPLYAGLLQAHHFRAKGLFLCSSGIALEHPIQNQGNRTKKQLVEVQLSIPKRFEKLMNAEEAWARHNHKVFKLDPSAEHKSLDWNGRAK